MNSKRNIMKKRTLSDRQVVAQLKKAERDGLLRKFIKDGVEFWVNNDQRQS